MKPQAQSHAAKILVADDEAPIRNALLAFLRREGYVCIGAQDGASALTELRHQNYDLLLTDIRMPGNSHMELIREVSQVAPGLPVIVLTGDPSLETAAVSVRLSVSAYLVKPPNLDELRGLVRQSIANYRACLALRGKWKEIESLSREASRQLSTATSDSDQALAQPRLVQALSDLLRMGLTEETNAIRQLAVQAEMVQALHETVQVLEQTRRSFKSKQLGALRQRLQVVLGNLGSMPREDDPPPTPIPSD